MCPKVTFNCLAINLGDTALRWYLNNKDFAVYTASNITRNHFEIVNSTLNSLIGDVDIKVKVLSIFHERESASFNSTMTVNIQSLTGAGISTIGCGSFRFNSSLNVVSDMIRREYRVS